MLALLRKSWVEARWLLAGSAAVVFAFEWLRVWLVHQLPQDDFRLIMSVMPDAVKRMLPVPWEVIATPLGRIAWGYEEPLVLIVLSAWAIARGSDSVSGELGRGTMEMLLAQPVRRISVLSANAAMTILGAALIPAAAWLGTTVGLATNTFDVELSPLTFLPAVLNLFSLTLFLAGLTTLASSCDQYRWRTIGVVGVAFVVSLVCKIVGRVAVGWKPLAYISFFTPYEPGMLVVRRDLSWSLLAAPPAKELLGALGSDGLLIAMAVVCYAGAAIIFCRRDLPAAV